MRFYKLLLPTLLLCLGCAADPNIFGVSSKEKTNKSDINSLIPTENIITRSKKNKYLGELVDKVTDAELSASQASDFILVVSGATESDGAYEPRLIQIIPEQNNTLRYALKAIHKTNRRKVKGTITVAITVTSEELENVDTILIESKKSTFELKL
tara:strand:- start:1466 stop:1930 length:465 start_codon:yes stop_codon:yes gene_type:complete